MHDKQRQASREARTTINALSVLNNWEYMPISEIVISYFKRNGKDIKFRSGRSPYLKPAIEVRDHHIKVSVYKDPNQDPDDPNTQLHIAFFLVCWVCDVYAPLPGMLKMEQEINPISRMDSLDPYVKAAEYLLSQLKHKK
jgi:hypothetical protein